jgi:hypothetical protein
MAQVIPLTLPIKLQCLRMPVQWECRRTGVKIRTGKKEIEDDAFRAEFVEGKPTPYDPWEMRAEFFRLRFEEGSAPVLQFLHKVGLFDTAEPEDVESSPGVADGFAIEYAGQQFVVRDQAERDLDYFWSVRGLAEISMRSKKNQFTVLDFATRFVQSKNGGYLLLTAVSFLEALVASLQIDFLRDAKFQKCARPDCAITFAVTGNRERKYCSWYCGHIESVRRKRGTKTSKR